jgi:predicted nucleotidyltransferase
MRAREGELIKTDNDVIFDVKGLVHPPNRIVAFPRYIPSPQGNRKSRKGVYDKIYSLSERFKFLQEKAPALIVHDKVFDAVLCEVPTNEVTRHYTPVEKLRKLRSAKILSALERKAVQLAETLKEAANIPWSAVGISGSILVGLYTLQSDIDPLVYGIESCRKAYAALENLREADASQFKPYTRKELQALFDFRSKDTIMSFEDFERTESRKAFQGMFSGTDYFIRFVKDWSQTSEQYGGVCYKDCGYAKITATVADDAEALFTPCTYQLENVAVVDGAKLQPIREIVSFRGRFCEQAKTGEAVVAQGKVERVTNTQTKREHYRLILGNKPSDFMALSQA